MPDVVSMNSRLQIVTGQPTHNSWWQLWKVNATKLKSNGRKLVVIVVLPKFHIGGEKQALELEGSGKQSGMRFEGIKEE